MIPSPLKWHGGKHYLAERILSIMPAHTHYVEPYFGSGAVLFRKNPAGVSEVANDLNGDLSNFWWVLQKTEWFQEFRRLVQAIPFSENEFNGASGADITGRNRGPLWRPERAVNFFIRCRQSRAGALKEFGTLSRTRTRRGMNEQAAAWLGAVEGLADAHERLKRVVILNRHALDVIRQQDGPATLFYLDPPYLQETRVAKKAYGEFEMSEADHRELLETLATIQGRFILSGYKSQLYSFHAYQAKWHTMTWDCPNSVAAGKKKKRVQETVWTNFSFAGALAA